MQHATFSAGLLSLGNMHLRHASMYFHDLLADCFLLQNDIPFYGGTSVHLPIHILKDILVASKIGQL